MIDINQITAGLFKKCVEDEIMTRSAFLEALNTNNEKIFEKYNSNRRWLIGTFFTTVGLIVAGFGLILTILLHH